MLLNNACWAANVSILCHVNWLLDDITGVYWHIGIGQTPQVTDLNKLPKLALHFENPRVGGSIPPLGTI